MSYDRPSPMRKVSDSARRLVRNPSSYQDKTTIVAQILLYCCLILICHGLHIFFIYQKRLRPLTRAPLGYSAERAPLGGGGADSAPLPNSRTNRRSEAGEAAIESPEREDSNAH